MTLPDHGPESGRSGAVAWGVLLLLSVCAMVGIFWVIAQGVGVSPDSTHYIETARSLVDGKGYTVNGKVMTHFPPGYPLLLAVMGIVTGREILPVARGMAVLFYGLNLFLMGAVFLRATRGNLISTVCMLTLFILSGPVLFVHSMAWSEAPFMMVTLTGLLVLMRYGHRPSVSRLLLMSGLIGYAVITRYIGIALIPAFTIILLTISGRSVTDKVKDALIFVFSASIPFGLLLTRNAWVTDSATNRTVALHPISMEHLTRLLETIWSFILPVTLSPGTLALLSCVLMMVLLFSVVTVCRSERLNKEYSSACLLVRGSGSCIAFYLVVLFLSMTYFDAQTPVDHRIIYPIYILMVLMTMGVLWISLELLPIKRKWPFFIMVAAIVCGCNAEIYHTRVLEIHRDGNGFTSRFWNQSETLKFLTAYEKPLQIYSNAGDLINFRTDHQAEMMPRLVSPHSHLKNEAVDAEMLSVLRRCLQGEAVVVYLDRVTWRWYLPSRQDMENMEYFPVYKRFSDGIIFGRIE